MGLAGIMFWAPDLDDFTGGLCNEGKYPLMNTAVNLLRGQTDHGQHQQSQPLNNTSTPQLQLISPHLNKGKRVVCYYTKYMKEKIKKNQKKKIFIFLLLVGHNIVLMEENFFLRNLDASLCTHIIYAFAVLKDSKLAPYEWNDEDTQWSKG